MTSPPPVPKPRRKRRRWVDLAVVGVLALAAFALAVPGSPVYLPKLLEPEPKVDGKTATQHAERLSDPDPEVRREAAAALGKLSTSGAKQLPKLVEAMRHDPDGDVRTFAADAVGKMAPASEAAVGDLGAALADPDRRVRMNAAIGLMRLKEKARPAVPDLIAAAADTDNDTNLGAFTVSVRQMCLRALGAAAAGTPDGVPTFTAELGRLSADANRGIAAQGLGLAGEHGRAAAPKIRAMLTDPNPEVREVAAEALAQMGEGRDGPVDGATTKLELPEDERVRLWEYEHRVNELNQYGFAPLAAAVAAGDEKALAKLLADGFAGSEPTEPGLTLTGFAAVERRAAGDKVVSLTGSQFVARLIGWRKLFGSGVSVKLVGATLQPTDPADLDGAWAGNAQLRLVGESASGGPAEVTAVIGIEAVGVSEKRLGEPGWLRAAHVRRQAVARSPKPLFEDVAKARGLDVKLFDNWTRDGVPAPNAGGVYVTDFDRDGYLDVLVTDAVKTALYRGGAGGKFTDVTAAVGLPAGGTDRAACWVDLDGDGWDDLILGRAVFRNIEGVKLADYTGRTNLPLTNDLSAVVPADFDRDGHVDLYLTSTAQPGNMSWLEGVGGDGQGNRLVRNLGGWRFEDVTKKSGTHGGYRSTFTAAWLDANDDGWPDLHVPNEFGDGVLFVNQHDGTFKPTALADRPVDFGTMGLAAGDLNNDGKTDLYCANMYSKAGTRVIGNMKPDTYPEPVMTKLRRFVAGSELHINRGGLGFTQVAAEKGIAAVGWAYGPALADLDGDGFLDIFATAGYISRDRRKPDG